jgi:hypothetical protein
VSLSLFSLCSFRFLLSPFSLCVCLRSSSIEAAGRPRAVAQRLRRLWVDLGCDGCGPGRPQAVAAAVGRPRVATAAANRPRAVLRWYLDSERRWRRRLDSERRRWRLDDPERWRASFLSHPTTAPEALALPHPMAQIEARVGGCHFSVFARMDTFHRRAQADESCEGFVNIDKKCVIFIEKLPSARGRRKLAQNRRK